MTIRKFNNYIAFSPEGKELLSTNDYKTAMIPMCWVVKMNFKKQPFDVRGFNPQERYYGLRGKLVLSYYPLSGDMDMSILPDFWIPRIHECIVNQTKVELHIPNTNNIRGYFKETDGIFSIISRTQTREFDSFFINWIAEIGR